MEKKKTEAYLAATKKAEEVQRQRREKWDMMTKHMEQEETSQNLLTEASAKQAELSMELDGIEGEVERVRLQKADECGKRMRAEIALAEAKKNYEQLEKALNERMEHDPDMIDAEEFTSNMSTVKAFFSNT